MQLRAVLKRYWNEHIAYLTTDYPRVFTMKQKNVLRLLGRFHIGEISHEHVNRYKTSRYKAGAKASTVRGELGIINAAYQWGVRSKWLTPADKPVIVLPPASETKDEWLTKEEALRLIGRAFLQHWRCGLFVVIGLFTGARPTRIRYLEWAKVDFDAGVIDMRPNGKAAVGKKRYGYVRIMPELMPYLKKAYSERAGGLVLQNTRELEYHFKQAVKAAKLDGRMVTMNTLRHTWATWSAMDGVDLYEIAKVLGNSIKTVEKKYAHHHPAYQKNATQRTFFGEGVLAPNTELMRDA